MRIEHFPNGNGGYFKAVVNGREAGLMSYNNSGPGEFVIDHTVVDSRFSGHGIGHDMVMEAVNYAREKGMKIVPLCSFARRVMARTKGITDVLAHYSLVP